MTLDDLAYYGDIKTLAFRFWSHVEKREGCWIWKGATILCGNLNCKDRERWRYGCFSATKNGRKKRFVATHVSYVLTYGGFSRGQIMRHKCDVPLCVNPEHLEPGSYRDNALDAVQRKRHRFVSNWKKGEEHPLARLTIPDVVSIRKRYLGGEMQDVIGIDYNMKQKDISRIVRGHIWKDAGGPSWDEIVTARCKLFNGRIRPY